MNESGHNVGWTQYDSLAHREWGQSAGVFHQDPAGLGGAHWPLRVARNFVRNKSLFTIMDKINSGQLCSS